MISSNVRLLCKYYMGISHPHYCKSSVATEMHAHLQTLIQLSVNTKDDQEGQEKEHFIVNDISKFEMESMLLTLFERYLVPVRCFIKIRAHYHSNPYRHSSVIQTIWMQWLYSLIVFLVGFSSLSVTLPLQLILWL